MGFAPDVLFNHFHMKNVFSSLLFFSLFLSACTAPSQEVQGEKLKVVATFYPLAFLAEEIGGTEVDLTNLVPVGSEPHDFEPSPSQIADLTSANVVLYLGEGFEPWMEDLELELETKEVLAVELNGQLSLLEPEDHLEEENEEEHDDHGAYDPHTWLDPLLMQDLAIQVGKAFAKADPENEALYSANTQALLTELQALHESYAETLSACANDTVLVSHDAMHYLAERYSFKAISVSGLSPDDEPSADRLTELADFAKENKSQYILFETLANPDVAETLAEEAGLLPLSFNPLEGLKKEQVEAGEDYLSIMQENLKNISTGLLCP